MKPRRGPGPSRTSVALQSLVDSEAAPGEGEAVVLSTLQDLVAWGRKNSLWPFGFGLSCCFVEMATSLTPRYDIARFGAEVLRISPREADVMIVAGTVFRKMAPVVLQLYHQMMEPRWVISMGSCANSGGMFDVYSVVQGVDSFLPVDVYIQGCPPAPTALMEGLLLLQAQVQTSGGRSAGSSARRQSRSRPRLAARRAPAGRRGDRQADPAGRGLTRARTTSARQRRQPGRRSPRSRPATAIAASDPPQRRGRARAARRASRTPSSPGSRPPTASRPSGSRRSASHDVLAYLKHEAPRPFAMLYDLGAIDERLRRHRDGQPESDFTIFYHLLSYERNADLRLKVALRGETPSIGTITDHLAGGRLVRARGLGHVRRRLPRPPAPQPHPQSAVVGRAPAAQGAPVPRHRARAASRCRRRSRADGRRSCVQARGVGPAHAPTTTPR